MSWCMDEVDFKAISKDNPCGFDGFKSIEYLAKEKCGDVPPQMGVYLVLWPGVGTPGFNSSNPGYLENSIMPKDVSYLESRWISGTRVVYIGKAGGMKFRRNTGLAARLQEYFKWKDGKKNMHKGGRDIWQINNPQNLIIAWRVIEEEEPEACEKRLLRKFKSEFDGKLPFANHRI